MTWIKFIFSVLGIYATYYLMLIFWDQRGIQKQKAGNEKPELSFTEDIAPRKVSVNDTAVNRKESPIVESGGVSLKQLFSLALEESVEYTKAVSF